jgi:uncharacterized protein (DUF362 family)
VALLHCTADDDLRARTRELIELLGGMRAVVCRGDKVFVKVNGTMARPKGDGAVVDAQVLWGVVEESYVAGAADVAVGDAALPEQGGTLAIFQQLGYVEVVEATGARLIDLNHPPFARAMVPGGGFAYRSLVIREELRAFDIVLNVAKMKDHSAAGITLGLKNMFGMKPMNPIMEFTKNSFHADVTQREPVDNTPPQKLAREFSSRYTSVSDHDKLARAIVGHNLTCPTSLAVVDGVIGMEGQGPWQGDPVNSEVLGAG